ncbi:MAG TPA: hypothetical protein VFG51_02265 [Candidatus Saccharimonadia bacterium]|nr:hypothetical protein [Candidatus Saccharimonadia bacterium]
MDLFHSRSKEVTEYRPLDQFGQIADIVFNAISNAGFKLNKGQPENAKGFQQNALRDLRSLRSERQTMGESVAIINQAIPLVENADWGMAGALVSLTNAIKSLPREK